MVSDYQPCKNHILIGYKKKIKLIGRK